MKKEFEKIDLIFKKEIIEKLDNLDMGKIVGAGEVDSQSDNACTNNTRNTTCPSYAHCPIPSNGDVTAIGDGYIAGPVVTAGSPYPAL
jgi:hypothetical protein